MRGSSPIHSLIFAKLSPAIARREPNVWPRMGLHHFVPTQPCFESSVHDKAHHPGLVFRHNFGRHLLPACQQSITKLRLAIFRFRPVIPPSHTDAGRRIRGNYGPFLLEPGKKRPQAHHVALSGGFGHTATFLPVESLQIHCLIEGIAVRGPTQRANRFRVSLLFSQKIDWIHFGQV